MADDKEDDLYETVARMADRLDLHGDERTDYIHEHMTRGGYRAVPQYVKDDEDERDSGKRRGSAFFSSGRGDSERDSGRRRSGSGDGGGRRSGGGRDRWYED